MEDTADDSGLNEELLAAIPPDMHRYAYIFMHPPMNSDSSRSMKFEPEEMNWLGRQVERMGFRPVEEQLDRYEAPRHGPIHPHNPGKWVPKTRPRPELAPTFAERLVAQFDLLPADERANAIAALTEPKEG